MRPKHTTHCFREIMVDFLAGLAVFLAVFAIAILDSRAARPSPGMASAGHADPQPSSPSDLRAGEGDAGMGTLLVGSGEDAKAAALAPAPRLDTDVRITITGAIARTVVTQRFRNPLRIRGEALYVLPLPREASVDTFSMRIGERLVEGRFKSQAETAFLSRYARDAGLKANLPDRRRANVFASSVTAVAPGEEITVRTEYQEMLRGNGEAYTLRFPLVAAPRYASQPHFHVVRHKQRTGAHPAGRALSELARNAPHRPNPVSLRVRLDAGFPLGTIKSGTHAITVERTGESTARVSLAKAAVPASRTFELTWRRERSGGPVAALFREKGGAGGYVQVMITPPSPEAVPGPPPRDVVFMIDTSGSMAGTTLPDVRAGVERALERLRPDDRFNIIRFADDYSRLFDRAVKPTAENLAIARDHLARLEGKGGTKLAPALTAAFENRPEPGGDGARLRQIVVLTDGAVSNEAELLSAVAAKRGRARLFPVGIGSAPNGVLMRRAAEIGRGRYIEIGKRKHIRGRITAFFEQLGRPVITNLKIEWPAGTRTEALPNPLPDLHAGQPLVVAARVSSLKGDVAISGTINGKPWKQTPALTNAAEGTGISRLWARRRIALLETRRYAGQNPVGVSAAIETVALEHRITSRMTHLIPVSSTPPQPGKRPLASEEMPFNLPAGWVRGNTLEDAGEQALLTRIAAAPSSSRTGIAPAQSRAGAASVPSGDTDTMASPAQDSSSSASGMSAKGPSAAGMLPDRRLTLIIMGLLFAAMTALTLGLWRHLRRMFAAPET